MESRNIRVLDPKGSLNMADGIRDLIVTADDFGIGIETSRGILDLAQQGLITSTVLLVNSPFARQSVHLWKQRGRPLELGWHPCLTLDRPILDPKQVPSLVDNRGAFLNLGALLRKLVRGRVSEQEIEAELRAQYLLFQELVGELPTNVNGHHHCHIFQPVMRSLQRVLGDHRPYVRRVLETSWSLMSVPGARIKRAILSQCGSRLTSDYPGNEELLGVTDPFCVQDVSFFSRWLRASQAQVVELTCHPGHLDLSIEGRDGTRSDGQIDRRVHEYRRLCEPAYTQALQEEGFALINGRQLVARSARPTSRIAA